MKKENIGMKKWNAPEMEELLINATANGAEKSSDYDGEWQQIDGKWYLPGSGKASN